MNRFWVLGILGIVSGGYTPIAEARINCVNGLSAFKSTLYPVLRMKCIACHDDQGIGPAHSSANVATAYPIAVGLVNFNDFRNSLFVKKVAQKHWLNYDDSSEGMTVDEMLPLLQAWWDEGESECETTYAFKSPQTEIPAHLPTRRDGKYITLSWEMEDCRLSIDIQEFAPIAETHLGAYRVKDPRIVCSKRRHVAGLRFFVNGQSEVFENIYDSVAADIPASTSPRVLSSEGMILMRRSKKDSLSFGFRTY